MSPSVDPNQAGASPPAAGPETHSSPDATAAGPEPALTSDALAAGHVTSKTTANQQRPQGESNITTEHAEMLSQARSPSPEADEKISAAPVNSGGGKAAAGGRAVINQRETIPTTGRRIPTTKWEYVTFCIFCKRSSFVVSLLRQII